jgi:hypothetical protein
MAGAAGPGARAQYLFSLPPPANPNRPKTDQ